MKCTIAALVLAVSWGLPAVRSSDPSSIVGVQEGSDASSDREQAIDFSSTSREVDADRGHRNLYVLPSWWDDINMILSPINLQRCYKRQFPPDDGARCSKKAKTCFFGTKPCPGGFQWPEVQCYCNGDGVTRGNWDCTDVGCPPPTQDDDRVFAPSSAPSTSMFPSAFPSISMQPSTAATTRTTFIKPGCCNSCPIISNCPWSVWFDFKDVSPFDSVPFEPCGTETPDEIDCIAVARTNHSFPVELITLFDDDELPVPARETGDLIGCGRCIGGICEDGIQPHGRCEFQYQYRVKCPCGGDPTPSPTPRPTFLGEVPPDIPDDDGGNGEGDGNQIDVGPLPPRPTPRPTKIQDVADGGGDDNQIDVGVLPPRPTPFPTRFPTTGRPADPRPRG